MYGGGVLRREKHNLGKSKEEKVRSRQGRGRVRSKRKQKKLFHWRKMRDTAANKEGGKANTWRRWKEDGT